MEKTLVIKYMVRKCTNAGSGIMVLEKHEFDTVEAAIEFESNQADGYFDWWEIKVEWTYEFN